MHLVRKELLRCDILRHLQKGAKTNWNGMVGRMDHMEYGLRIFFHSGYDLYLFFLRSAMVQVAKERVAEGNSSEKAAVMADCLTPDLS